MKTYRFKKYQLLLAFATIFMPLVMVIFTSCQEQDFASDFGFESSDDLRAAIASEKVAKELTKNLGYEVNHKADQFGFDVAAKALQIAQTRAATRASGLSDVPAVYKSDGPNIAIIDKEYGLAKNITDAEHREVFAWFSSHKVEWANTPTYVTGLTSTRQIKGGNGVYGTAKLITDSPYINQYGSLTHYNINQLGDATVGSAVHFNYAWIQLVALDEECNDEINEDKSQRRNGGTDSFNELGLYDGSEWKHCNDFNAKEGWGYGRQDGTWYYNMTGKYYPQNGVFFNNIDCSQITAHSNQDSQFHDKWIIVTLKGDDYEGTYLGFDFEAGGQNANQRYAANGICNDWIIKITPATTDISKFENYRIMCEDLGASFDVDYNDLVLDVEWDGLFEGNVLGLFPTIKIKVVSACGSLPISIWYNGDYKGEVHEQLGARMKNDGTYDPIPPSSVNQNRATLTYIRDYGAIDAKDQINLIDIKVCQDPAAWKKAKQQGKMAEKAIWTSVHNFAGMTPLKICVPQCVRVATESGINGDRRFEKAYPMFPKWLKNEETYSGTGFPFWEICDERWVYSN